MKRKRNINIFILTYANGLGDNTSLSYKTGKGHAQISVPAAKSNQRLQRHLLSRFSLGVLLKDRKVTFLVGLWRTFSTLKIITDFHFYFI